MKISSQAIRPLINVLHNIQNVIVFSPLFEDLLHTTTPRYTHPTKAEGSSRINYARNANVVELQPKRPREAPSRINLFIGGSGKKLVR